MSNSFCTWIEPGRLLASAAPRDSGDYERWTAAGVTVVINLHTVADDPAALASARIESKHLPVADFTAPSPRLLAEAVGAIDSGLAAGGVVAVHCHAGLGRTGTVVAAWLVAQGATADEAILRVRTARPSSIETVEQEVAIRQFGDRLRRGRS